MIPASNLKSGMVVRLDGHLCQILTTEHHMGGGRMGSLAHIRIRNLATSAVGEKRFRPDERVEMVDVDKQKLDYLYQDGDLFFFMNPVTFDQIPIPQDQLGGKVRFLSEGMGVTGLFLDEKPIAILFPDHVDLKVVTAPAPLREQDTSTYKKVTLENRLEVLTPQFIKEGDTVRVDTETGKYLNRV
ncbi:MAG: elongation factor P [Acidobacteria bacterium]|nr:MAG: elongation factor P [Acidobacteriota bacterium]